MQQPTEAQVLAALAHYRERIVSHNREAFTKFIQMAETALPKTPKTPASTHDLGFPEDLWILMGLVDSLGGHGWPLYHEHGQQIRVWDGRGASAAENLVDPAELNMEGWDVLAGWECGSGPETVCYVLYCRAEEEGRSDEDDDGGGGDTSWRWRYVADMGQDGVEVFANIVELLEWYDELHVVYLTPGNQN